LRAKLGREHESLIGTVRNVGYKAVRPARGRSGSAVSDLSRDGVVDETDGFCPASHSLPNSSTDPQETP